MEKKLYSKPLLRTEQFTPQEFVAACVISPSLIPTPVSSSSYYKVDGVDTDGTHNSSKLNGHYDTSEQITSVHTLTQTWINNFFVKGPSQGYHFHIEKAYTSKPGVAQYVSSMYYDNPSYFGGPVAILHQTRSSSRNSDGIGWYLLSNDWKGDNIDNYMGGIKNNS